MRTRLARKPTPPAMSSSSRTTVRVPCMRECPRITLLPAPATLVALRVRHERAGPLGHGPVGMADELLDPPQPLTAGEGVGVEVHPRERLRQHLPREAGDGLEAGGVQADDAQRVQERLA